MIRRPPRSTLFPYTTLFRSSDLGMPLGLQRLLVGHMGCYAAIPGLAAVSDFVTARSRPAVLLCCELTSLHVQPAQRDLEQAVAHPLFSDAAAAVVLEPGAGRRSEEHTSELQSR